MQIQNDDDLDDVRRCLDCNEVFVVTRPARVPGFYRVDRRIYLQFRRGCLTGWKNDWRRPPRGLL